MSEIDNINFLRNRFKNIYDRFKNYDKEIENIFFEDTISQDPTLLVYKNSNYLSLHSRYSPLDEAETILNEYKNEIEKNDYIVFYGIGFGYIVEMFDKLYPNKKFAIYEPIEELFYLCMCNKNICYKNLDCIGTGNQVADMEKFLDKVFEEDERKVFFVWLPAHSRIFNEEYKNFKELLSSYIKNKRVNLYGFKLYQEKWLENSVHNFECNLNTPDIFWACKDYFKGKTAVIAAAGPSIEFDIENLKMIQKNNMAVIFAIGSGLKVLLKNGIKPDAVISYDPNPANYNSVFKEVTEEIPLIYGTSINLDILENYDALKFHFVVNRDTVSPYYLKDKEDMYIVSDAPSVATVAVEVLAKLGFSRIIFAGQNLAFYNEKLYPQDMYKEKNELYKVPKDLIIVKDVYGREVRTTVAFDFARRQIETYIQIFKDIEFINSTKGGAYIAGVPFMNMEDIISQKLEKNNVCVNFEEFLEEHYDTEYMKNQKNLMDNSKNQYKVLTNTIFECLKKIKSLARNKNIVQLDNTYIKLNQIYTEIWQNDYFNIYIKPMNEVAYTYFDNNMPNITKDKNYITKAEKVINEFNRFFKICENSEKNKINYLYKNIDRVIEENSGEFRGGYKLTEYEICLKG